MLIQEIKTTLNSFEMYLLFKDEPYSFFLDSGRDPDTLGRYSFIGGSPLLVFSSKGDVITLKTKTKEKQLIGQPFEELQKLLKQYKREYSTEFPFIGGAVGYFGYDLCHQLENLPRSAVDDVNIPDCFMGFYDGIVIVDHKTNKTYAAALGFEEAETVIVNRIKAKFVDVPQVEIRTDFKVNENIVFQGNFTKAEYMKALDAVHEYIRAGDIYQTNLTQRFNTDLQVTPLELYNELRKINPAPFASYIDFGSGQIVSSSPERFIKIQGRNIETRPIKGTMPRGKTAAEDAANRQTLITSEKDKAELLMIVDLERNDLGKIAKTGTVKVPELYKLEEYETVFHLVATVTAELKDGLDAIDCVKATFPGGSITGAPKIRAMEIIDELEPTQRNIYTGSIGYIGFNGDLDLNIVIRTIVCKDGKGYFQVGGGIVWDSDNQSEYEETFHKGKALMDALKRY
ncbi:aminodeoxychorismate synthase component I [Acetobacterium woodii]|uniref:Anthranilate synthase component 1 n=1 Tax=Acetobacterium woodii (strain ATCC 29683 / DSM 1030 / JCM 2381 / KCTC 1655 / WB1) TaxID=931626 RepID=H6LJ42_ACEWD|nr:aminodeoxychorismate synthase component I [Acetobacterium woodii]AFA47405.1 para-aminobenzoate synthase, component I [Acetobacterium woodii DSM 1030]